MLQIKASKRSRYALSLALNHVVGTLLLWTPSLLFLLSVCVWGISEYDVGNPVLAGMWINSIPGFLKKTSQKLDDTSTLKWVEYLPIASLVVESSTGNIIVSNPMADHLLMLSPEPESPHNIRSLLDVTDKSAGALFTEKLGQDTFEILTRKADERLTVSISWKEISPEPDQLILLQLFTSQSVSVSSASDDSNTHAADPSDHPDSVSQHGILPVLRDALGHLPQGIMITSADGTHCLYTSDRLKTLFNLPNQLYVDHPRWWIHVIASEDHYKVKTLWKELNSRGESTIKVSFMAPAGSVKTLIWKAILGSGSSGQGQVAYHFFTPDVTTITGRWSSAVEESFIKESKIGLWAWDRQRESVHWSNEFFDLHQIDHDFEPDIKLPFPFVTEPTKFDLKYVLETIDPDHLPLSTEYQVELPNGSVKDFILGVSEIRKTVDGATTFLAGFIKDITVEREESRVQKKLLNEIRGNQQLIKEFSTALSHRLRVPVAQIQGILSIISREGGDPSQSHITLLNECTEDLDLALYEMNDLINMHKGEEGESESFTWQELWKPVAMEFQKKIIELRASVMVDFSGAGQVTGIKENLQGIVSELLNNSIRFRDEHRLLEIHAYTEQTDEQVWFHLQDNGTGMDLQENDQAPFELYKRFHRKSGKGFGLFLSKMWAESMGGAMSLTSIQGVGTRVSLAIPRESED